MKLIPKRGAWILIIKPILVKDSFVPYMSVWYGLPTGTMFIGDEMRPDCYINYEIMFKYNFDSMEQAKLMLALYFGNKSGLKESQITQIERLIHNEPIHQQMKILTPFGSVFIQPDEYNVVDVTKYFESMKDGSIQLKHMNNGKTLGKKVEEQLFYLRSRGISMTTAIQMVSGSMKTQNGFYLLPHPEYQRMFLRNFEWHYAKEQVFKAKMVKKDSNNIKYFFDEEAALKLNQKAVS